MTQNKPIKLGHYDILCQLGSGCNADVYKCLDTKTREPLAFKLSKSPSDDKYLKNEVNILTHLNHPNIISCKSNGIIEKNGMTRYYSTLELCQKNTLYEFLAKTERFEPTIARTIFSKLLLTLEYLHQNNYCHLDVKLENILVDNQYNFKLADFGFALPLTDSNYKICGTDVYRAPEMYSSTKYDRKQIDVFALGVLLFCLVFGYHPFSSTPYKDSQYSVFINKNQSFWEKELSKKKK